MMDVAVKSSVWTLGLCVLLQLGCAGTRAASPEESRKETTMTRRASGTFDVKLTPMTPDAQGGDPGLGRMLIDKRFHGELEGTSQGQMLATMHETIKDSGAYVALERVSAKLNGRAGTFVLQHSGTMARGAQSLSVTVVPDSGSGELKGLTGSMRIIITGRQHAYEFDYALPEKP
jgi:hypothetical protein